MKNEAREKEMETMEQQERDSAVGACCGRQRMDDAKRNVRVAEAPHATAGLDSTSIQRIIQSNYIPPRLQPALGSRTQCN